MIRLQQIWWLKPSCDSKLLIFHCGKNAPTTALHLLCREMACSSSKFAKYSGSVLFFWCFCLDHLGTAALAPRGFPSSVSHWVFAAFFLLLMEVRNTNYIKTNISSSEKSRNAGANMMDMEGFSWNVGVTHIGDIGGTFSWGSFCFLYYFFWNDSWLDDWTVHLLLGEIKEGVWGGSVTIF